MNWIEAVFHVDPDHGSGAIELLVLAAVVMVLAGALVRWRRRATTARLAPSRAAGPGPHADH
ncbi:MAG TPA: hypothetical protein VNN74_04795 [Candidatus Micrarchaeia archaeon]|nr:hypothetical protein [Candidatus Micrarchaeia archaeon]